MKLINLVALAFIASPAFSQTMSTAETESVEVLYHPESKKILVLGDESKHTVEQLAAISAQVGLHALYTLEFLDQIYRDEKPWIDGSLKLQPSKQQQHIVLSGDFHPLKNIWYTGLHSQINYLNAPWNTYYDPAFDRTVGFGVQAGARKPFGKKHKILGSFEIGYTWNRSVVHIDLPKEVYLRVGFGYRVLGQK